MPRYTIDWIKKSRNKTAKEEENRQKGTFMDETWSTSYYVVFATSLLFLIFIISKLNKRRGNLPPAPPSLPVIGHLHLIKEPIHRTLEALSYRYGPVLSLSFGYRNVVVVSSPSAVEECFTRNDVVLANRPQPQAGKHLTYNFTLLGSAPYGRHWRNLRRITTMEILSVSRLDSFLSIRREEVRLLVKGLYQVVSERGVARVEMRTQLRDLTFNVIMRMALGKRYFSAAEEAGDTRETEMIKETIREIFELTGTADASDFLPALRWLNMIRKDQGARAHEKADRILQGLVDEHKKRRNEHNDHKTMIDVMLSMQDSEPEQYSDDIIKGQILTMLLGGVDTSAIAMEWAMSLLLNHPEVMEKARAEVDHVVGRDRLVDESDINNLYYLQDVIKETLRLFPPGPLLVPHEASEDCTVAGFRVPRGSMVMINAWKIHRDPELWIDPLAFKPERHDGIRNVGYKFIPFGVGRRGCPGTGLVGRIVPFALAALIQCFEWERVGKEPVNLEEGTGVAMPKLRPLEAMCRARECMVEGVLTQLV